MATDDETMLGIGGHVNLVAVVRLLGLDGPGGLHVLGITGGHLIAGTFFLPVFPRLHHFFLLGPAARGDYAGIHNGALPDDDLVRLQLTAQEVKQLQVQASFHQVIAETADGAGVGRIVIKGKARKTPKGDAVGQGIVHALVR